MVKNVKDGAKLKFKFGSKTSTPAVLEDTKSKKGSLVDVEAEKDKPSSGNIAQSKKLEDAQKKKALEEAQKKKEREDALKKMAKARCAKKIPISLLDDVKGKEELT